MGHSIPLGSFEPFPVEDKIMMMEAIQDIYPSALENMRGVFSRAELKAILSICTNAPIDPRFAGQALKHACFAAVLEDKFEPFEIKSMKFLAKVWRLHPFELIALDVWGKQYCVKNLAQSPDKMAEHIGVLQ
jgi:hypothetical protein